MWFSGITNQILCNLVVYKRKQTKQFMYKHLTFHSPLLVACFLLIAACHKKRDNTLAIHLKIISATTGLAVKSKVTLDYEKTGADYAENHHLELGDTDEAGRMEIRQDVTHWRHLKLRIHGYGAYSNFFAQGISAVKDVQAGKLYAETIKLHPNNHYLLSARNTACFDETDTVWITHAEGDGPKYMLTGCADTLLRFGPNMYDFSFWTLNSSIAFNLKIKRNGNTTIEQQVFELTEQVTTPVHIEY